MYSNNRKFITIIIILSLFLQNYCITVPEKPISDSDLCISNYFQVRREIKAIKNRNYFVNSIFGGLSFGFFIFYGPVGLIVATPIPFVQLFNNHKEEKIYIEWKEKQCKQKNGT